jgi:hypothetical protein
LRELDERGFRLVGRVLPLEALATVAGTFDGQAELLGRWIDQALDALINDAAIA